MVNTIKNVKITITAMYSTQSPPFLKGVETAAAISLPNNYIKCFSCIQVGCHTEKFVCRIHFTVILRHYNMGVK